MERLAGSAPVGQLVAACRGGGMAVLVEDTRDGVQGQLVIAADHAGAEAINYLARHARGLVCVALHEAIVDRLRLSLLPQTNRARLATAYTISIEAREGVSTGISARDRALTIAAAIRPDARAEDLASPGHVFPIRVEEGEIRARPTAAAALVELCRDAGLSPAGVLCAIMNADGSMAGEGDLVAFAETHGLPIARARDIAPDLC
ncbi:3,4-dihydroxy-2-butanone-4-phosphate synthase [Salipiger sp.]